MKKVILAGFLILFTVTGCAAQSQNTPTKDKGLPMPSYQPNDPGIILVPFAWYQNVPGKGEAWLFDNKTNAVEVSYDGNVVASFPFKANNGKEIEAFTDVPVSKLYKITLGGNRYAVIRLAVWYTPQTTDRNGVVYLKKLN